MSGLAQLQQDFLAWLTAGDASLLDAITERGNISRELRLDIYRNAYHLRLLEALADAYPALHTLLGDARFQAAGLDYIRHHPSHHFSIRWFGHRLPPFLQQRPEWREIPVLAEMARFEWTLREVFDARDSRTVVMEELAQMPPQLWAGMQICLIPSARRLDLTWNTPRLWQAITAGEPARSPEQNPFPVGWLIWRQGLETHYHSLEVDEAWALDSIGSGTDFSGICAGLCEWVDEAHAPAHAAGMLQGWIKSGLVARISS